MASCSRNAMEHMGDWVPSALILHISLLSVGFVQGDVSQLTRKKG